ncbi:MAG: hypothetical protein AAFQ02_06405 [Bacteroidota bacterium]
MINRFWNVAFLGCLALAKCGDMIAQCPDNSPTWDASNIGSAYVSELGKKSVFGDFYNVRDAQYVNDGRAYFFGSIYNEGFFGDGFGNEYLGSCDGKETFVSGRGATEFNIVEVDNPGGIQVELDARIKTNLEFSSGLVSTDRTKFGHRVFFREGATYRSSSNTKHINGRSSRQGQGTFTFPVGDGDHLGMIGIRGANDFDIYTTAYYSRNLSDEEWMAEGTYDRTQVDFDVLQVQEKEHWTLRGSQVTRITLHWTAYSEINELVDNVEDLIVVGWDGDQWVDLGNTEVFSAFGSGSVTSKDVIPNRYRAFTFGTKDTDGDKYADSVDADRFDPCIPDPTLPVCTERVCVEVNTAVYLEGALMRGGLGDYADEMKSDLHRFGYLPGQRPRTLLGLRTRPGHPYRDFPFNYDGIEGEGIDETDPQSLDNYPESGFVDWVLVSLRSSEDVSSTICSRAAYLMSDGEVVMPEAFDCCNAETDQYYIVIEHRNHLPVMTPVPVVVSEGMVSYDFRINQSYTRLLGSGQKQIRDGMYVMYAGNGDQVLASESPKDINANDISLWAADNGKHSGYYTQDYDLNGDVNVHDKAIWLVNNGVFTDVDR